MKTDFRSPLGQFLNDSEAVRGSNILKVETGKIRLERGDMIDELRRIADVQANWHRIEPRAA